MFNEPDVGLVSLVVVRWGKGGPFFPLFLWCFPVFVFGLVLLLFLCFIVLFCFGTVFVCYIFVFCFVTVLVVCLLPGSELCSLCLWRR